MRFLLDESAEARIAGFLTAHGHDSTRIGRDYPASLPDEAVLALAHREQRILITIDKDFGELVVREHQPHAGVVLFRFPLDSTAHQKIRALEAPLASRPAPLDQLFVLTPQGIRTH
jgi:predicted nuclease of predicted toxin-antitoxin system